MPSVVRLCDRRCSFLRTEVYSPLPGNRTNLFVSLAELITNIHQSIFVSMFVQLSVCTFANLYVCLHVFPSVCMFVRLHECLYACLYVCWSAYLLVSMSVSLYIFVCSFWPFL